MRKRLLAAVAMGIFLVPLAAHAAFAGPEDPKWQAQCIVSYVKGQGELIWCFVPRP